MSQKVTVRDIAKKLNISHTTVSRVLSGAGNGFISEATAQRVFDAAQSMGYRPNLMARALATGRSNTITLWSAYAYNSYVATVLSHVHQVVKHEGILLNIWDVDQFAKGFPSDKHSFPISLSDGIIALELPDFVAQYSREPIMHRLPLVSIGGSPFRSGDYVGLDISTGTLEAMRHLADIGCRRIGFLVPENDFHIGDARYNAYHSVIQDANIQPEIIIARDNTRADALDAVTEYVTHQGYPNGLFCYNDDMAIGANRALREAGISVPGDVAIVGCNGIEETEYQNPPLSTISLPLQEMSRMAWQFLKARIADPEAPVQQMELKTHLVIRGSSAFQSTVSSPSAVKERQVM
jgi:LacI family transcriptional regulator